MIFRASKDAGLLSLLDCQTFQPRGSSSVTEILLDNIYMNIYCMIVKEYYFEYSLFNGKVSSFSSNTCIAVIGSDL